MTFMAQILSVTRNKLKEVVKISRCIYSLIRMKRKGAIYKPNVTNSTLTNGHKCCH